MELEPDLGVEELGPLRSVQELLFRHLAAPLDLLHSSSGLLQLRLHQVAPALGQGHLLLHVLTLLQGVLQVDLYLLQTHVDTGIHYT